MATKSSEGGQAVDRQGEWTPEYVEQLRNNAKFYHRQAFDQDIAVADAHNAAIHDLQQQLEQYKEKA